MKFKCVCVLEMSLDMNTHKVLESLHQRLCAMEKKASLGVQYGVDRPNRKIYSGREIDKILQYENIITDTGLEIYCTSSNEYYTIQPHTPNNKGKNVMIYDDPVGIRIEWYEKHKGIITRRYHSITQDSIENICKWINT